MEVVVVDDGSTDSSPEIARRFPVRYIRQPNRGLSEARNAGIRESKGSYLVFLDADDRLKPQAIEAGLRALAQRPDCAMTVGDHVFIAADGSYLASSAKESPLHSHYEALLKSNFIEMISSVLFRRSIFDEVGGFDATLRVAEDYELYLRIAREWPICCHAVIVAEYRKHGANTSRNSELMLTTTLQVLKNQAKYLDNDSGRLIAFHEGVRSWRKQYGRQLASELARSYSSCPWIIFYASSCGWPITIRKDYLCSCCCVLFRLSAGAKLWQASARPCKPRPTPKEVRTLRRNRDSIKVSPVTSVRTLVICGANVPMLFLWRVKQKKHRTHHQSRLLLILSTTPHGVEEPCVIKTGGECRSTVLAHQRQIPL